MNSFFNRSKSKQIKKVSTKQKHLQCDITPTPAPNSNVESIIEVLCQTTEPFKMPIDIMECNYTLTCITMFNNWKFNQDLRSFHLGKFKVHEYNAKAIKAVQKYVEKAKLSYELNSAFTIISTLWLKYLTKTIENPLN